MKKLLTALFLLASIAGKGQYISNDRWALFYYPHGFDSVRNGVTYGGSRPGWRSVDERQDTALSMIVEYVEKIWLDAAIHDFNHSYEEGLLRRRLDSLQKRLDSPKQYKEGTIPFIESKPSFDLLTTPADSSAFALDAFPASRLSLLGTPFPAYYFGEPKALTPGFPDQADEFNWHVREVRKWLPRRLKKKYDKFFHLGKYADKTQAEQ